MTLVSLNTKRFFWPGLSENIGGGPSGASSDATIATGQYQLMVFVAPQDMTIGYIGWRSGATVASGAATISLTTINNSTGLDSGDIGGGSPTAFNTGAITSNTWRDDTFTNSVAITDGTLFGVKFAYQAGTSFQNCKLGNIMVSRTNVPYEAPNGTVARLNAWKNFVLGTDSSHLYQIDGTAPCTSGTTTAITSAATQEQGLRFQVPFSCTCIGMRWWNSTSTGDYVVLIRNDAGAEQNSSSTAFSVDGGVNAAGNIIVYFGNPVSLTANTWYRADIRPTSGTVSIGNFTVNNVNQIQGWPGGPNIGLSVSTDSGSTFAGDSATVIPLIDIIISQVDDGLTQFVGGFSIGAAAVHSRPIIGY